MTKLFFDLPQPPQKEKCYNFTQMRRKASPHFITCNKTLQRVLQSSELKKDRNNKAEKRLKKLGENNFFYRNNKSISEKKLRNYNHLFQIIFLVFDKFPLSQNYVGRRPLGRRQKML